MPEANIKVDGFVIKVTNYSDRDRYISILTKDRGIVSVLCRGVRSRNNQYLSLTDIYTYAHFELFVMNHKYFFSSATCIYEFTKLRLNLLEQTAISQMIELIEDFLPNREDGYNQDEIDEAQQIYQLLIRAIYYAEKREDDITLILSIFTYKLLNIMGYGLNLSLDQDHLNEDINFTLNNNQLFFSFKERKIFKVKTKDYYKLSSEEFRMNSQFACSNIIMPQVDVRDNQVFNKGCVESDNAVINKEKNEDLIPLSKDLYRSLLWISQNDISSCYNFSLSQNNKHLLYIFTKRYLQEQVDKVYKKLTFFEDLIQLMKK